MPPSPASPQRSDGRATRWAGQRERRREEFVEAALRAIVDHGPDLSTEQIAEQAGVARTQLYKHFADADDIRRAVAARVAELLKADLAPLWRLQGSPHTMIGTVIDAHTRWLSENRNLYRYLSMQAAYLPSTDQDPITDVKTTIAQHLTRLFEFYLRLFKIDTRAATPVAFSVVGLVDAGIAHWLDDPRDMDHAEISALLSRWVWHILDDTLRAGGVHLDPDAPLGAPDLPFPQQKSAPEDT